jgi:aspartate aminotransferase
MDHLKPHIRSSRQSQTLLANQLSRERASKGERVFGFGFGQSPFPVPEEIRVALADAAHRKEYMNVQGHPPLREAIVDFHRQLEAKEWSADRVVVGAGSKILLFCLLAAFRRAEVLLPAPSWVSYEPQARLAGHDVSWLVTTFEDRWRLTPDRLERFCCSRGDTTVPLVLVFNYPSNPSGQTYSPDQLQALAAVMQRHRIVVIADEIYSLLSYDSDYATLDQFYPEGCIVTSGLSKWCGAGGWRLGFAHIPTGLGREYLEAVLGIASETYSCAPAPVQVAAERAYGNPAVARVFLDKQVAVLSEVGRYCADTLRQAGVKVHPAMGGFYLFPDFDRFRTPLNSRGVYTGEQLVTELLADAGVVLLPGSAFGMPAESLSARLAFVDFDGEQVAYEGSGAPEFDRVKEGMHELCAWLGRLD